MEVVQQMNVVKTTEGKYYMVKTIEYRMPIEPSQEMIECMDNAATIEGMVSNADTPSESPQ